MTSNLLDGLNENQKKAVTHIDGPLLVLAGAGAGKTRVITHRIAYLTEVAGIPPQNILAVTFTNKAAGEMKHRLRGLMGPDVKKVWMGTFHSIGLAILRMYGEKTAAGANFAIVDQDDRNAIVRDVVKELSIDAKKYSPKMYMQFISDYKNTFEFVARQEIPEPMHRFKDVFTKYEEELRRQKLIDFDDMLSLSLRLFLEDKEVLQYYKNLCRYILVDEYQDTNVIQFAFLRELAGESGNICVVGDDDQSIYGWRGADVENILYFDNHFKNVTEIKLVDNYRSAPEILYAANRLIHNNLSRRGKELVAKSDRKGQLTCNKMQDERIEAAYVSDIVARSLKEGIPADEIAVLYRTNAQSRNFEVTLNAKSIPYKVVGGIGFYQRREIKDVLAYLRLFDNPYDESSFARVCKSPPKGVGDTLVEKISNYALANNLDLLSALEIMIPSVSSRQAGGLSTIRNIMHKIVATDNIQEMIEIIVDDSGYKDYLMQVDEPEEAKARLENVYELYNAATSYEEGAELSSVSEFLATSTLATSGDDTVEGTVKLMSIHAAKGLEFETVFITGLEEGIFPLLSQDDEGDVEEERRLCYVAITRAKEHLYISYTASRLLHGKRQLMRPSRFLKEAGVQAGGAVRAKNEEISPSDGSFRKGMAVTHEIFGNGVVMGVSGTGDNAKVDVFFKKSGMKKLVARFLTPA